MIIWFTGQPGSGKTTLCEALKKHWWFLKDKCIHIDGDDIRNIFQNKNYNFDGRVNNIKTAQNIATFLHNKGYRVLVSLVSPYKKLREELRGQDIYQVYCHTTEIRGREHFFVDNYEPPTENFIDMDTTDKSVKECVDEILNVCG